MGNVKMCCRCGLNESHDNRSYCKKCNSRMAQESFARRFPTVEERRKYHAERRASKRLNHPVKIKLDITKEPEQGEYKDKGDKLFTDLLRRGKERLKWENKRIPKMRGD